MPTVVSGGKSYAAATSTRKEMKTVECQTSLMWGFSEHLLKTVLFSVRSSGGPGLVSAGTQADTQEVEAGIGRCPGSMQSCKECRDS